MSSPAMSLIEEWADNGWTVNLEYLQHRADHNGFDGGWSCEVYEIPESPMPGAYVEGIGTTAVEAIEKAAAEIAKAKAAAV
jgi:hypothetical protein